MAVVGKEWSRVRATPPQRTGSPWAGRIEARHDASGEPGESPRAPPARFEATSAGSGRESIHAGGAPFFACAADIPRPARALQKRRCFETRPAASADARLSSDSCYVVRSRSSSSPAQSQRRSSRLPRSPPGRNPVRRARSQTAPHSLSCWRWRPVRPQRPPERRLRHPTRKVASSRTSDTGRG